MITLAFESRPEALSRVRYPQYSWTLTLVTANCNIIALSLMSLAASLPGHLLCYILRLLLWGPRSSFEFISFLHRKSKRAYYALLYLILFLFLLLCYRAFYCILYFLCLSMFSLSCGFLLICFLHTYARKCFHHLISPLVL